MSNIIFTFRNAEDSKYVNLVYFKPINFACFGGELGSWIFPYAKTGIEVLKKVPGNHVTECETLKEVICAIQEQYDRYHLFTTLNHYQEGIRRLIEEAGFKLTDTLYNPNSGNEVYFFTYNSDPDDYHGDYEGDSLGDDDY
jgi:hypothetical protein